MECESSAEFSLSEAQASGVLEMPLRRLTGLEVGRFCSLVSAETSLHCLYGFPGTSFDNPLFKLVKGAVQGDCQAL
jgi:hypothetical protein